MKKTLLMTIAFLYTGTAFAGEINAESKISEVTVFPDRADVSRQSSFSLPSGKHTVVFDNLPDGLITDSVRVSGKGSAGFTIGSVETKNIYTTDLAVAEEKKLQEEISRLRDERRAIDSRINAANTSKNFLENVARSPASLIQADKNPAGFSPALLKETYHVINDGMAALGKDVLDNQIQIRSLDDKINALNARLRQIATGRKSYKQIRVNVEAGKNVQAKLTLQYQITGASWHSLYEARLDSTKGKVNIVQYGNISQNTGEDWSNVALTLSTARPSVSMQPPVLPTIWLNTREKAPVVQVKSFKAAPLRAGRAMANFADSIATQAVEMDLGAAPMLDEAAGFVETAAVGTEFSGVFAIKGDSNVPADGSEYRFNIGDYMNNAEIRAEIFPKTDTSAYLIATSVFNGQLPLLPGRIALFRDGEFIGNSYLEMVRPNEKVHLAFGQDEKIRAVYSTLGGETSEGGVITRETRKDAASRTEVQNLHNQPLKIAVYDQLPVSRNSDVSVKIIKDKTTADYEIEPDKKVGLIRWESVYQPQEKKEILYGYTVSWPKEKILTEN